MSRPATGKATPERRYMLHRCHLHPPHTTHYNNLNCLFIFWAPHPTVSSLAIQQHIKIYTKAHTHRRSLLVTRPLLTPFSNSQQHTPAASQTKHERDGAPNPKKMGINISQIPFSGQNCLGLRGITFGLALGTLLGTSIVMILRNFWGGEIVGVICGNIGKLGTSQRNRNNHFSVI